MTNKVKTDKKSVIRLPEYADEYYETEAKQLGIKPNALKTMILTQYATKNRMPIL